MQVLFGMLAVLAARLLLACVQQLRRRWAGAWPPADAAILDVAGLLRPARRRPRQLALALGDYERGPPARR